MPEVSRRRVLSGFTLGVGGFAAHSAAAAEDGPAASHDGAPERARSWACWTPALTRRTR